MSTASNWDLDSVRGEFPALHQTIHGHPLTYLDSAATALKPRSVVEAVRRTWEFDCGNIHRGVHLLSQRATQRYEAVRDQVRNFLGARDRRSIIFVRGATEAINLVAQSYALPRLRSGDEILISGLEHHANLVPWQVVAQRTGAQLRVVPMTDQGDIPLERFEVAMGPRTRLVAVTHVSNALGTVLPVREITRLAHQRGAVVLVDAAQSVPHRPVDVSEIDCDFLAFSSHKLYGPDGVGVLYGRLSLLEEMEPYQTGGDMIRSVTFERTEYADPPHRFEAGTPAIAGVHGLGAAIDFLGQVGWERLMAHEQELLHVGAELLAGIDGVRLVGQAAQRSGVLSFVVDGIHPHDLGTVLDGEGIAIRTGHHCAQPVIDRLGLGATARASLGMFNGVDDLLRLAAGIRKAKELFS